MNPPIKRFRVTVRIEADVTLTETGDARGLLAKYEVRPEALVEPDVPQQAAEALTAAVCEKALKIIRGHPEMNLTSPAGPSPEIRMRFGYKEASG